MISNFLGVIRYIYFGKKYYGHGYSQECVNTNEMKQCLPYTMAIMQSFYTPRGSVFLDVGLFEGITSPSTSASC